MLASSTPSSSYSKSFWSSLLKRDVTRFVGIDIGVNRVCVASIGRSEEERNDNPSSASSLAWFSRTQFALPVDSSRPPDADLVDTVCETLSDRLPRCVDGERHLAAVALPLPWIHYETASANELEQSQKNCDAMFGASVFRSPAHLCSWPVWEGKPQRMVVATAELSACRIAETIARLGYQVQHILPHGVALIHAAQPLTTIVPSAVVLLEFYGGLVATAEAGPTDVQDLGTTGPSEVLHNRWTGHCGLCRPLPAFTQPSQVHADINQLEPWLEEIASEIDATMRYADRLTGKPKSSHPVLISGPVAQINGVDQLLATLLGRPVATWRFSSTRRPGGQSDPAGDVTFHDPSRAVAISLAHCAAWQYRSGGRG